MLHTYTFIVICWSSLSAFFCTILNFVCPALYSIAIARVDSVLLQKIKKIAQMMSIESKRLPSFILSVVRKTIISRNCKFSLLRKLSERDCHKLAGCRWTFRKSALSRHNIRPHRQKRTWFRN